MLSAVRATRSVLLGFIAGGLVFASYGVDSDLMRVFGFAVLFAALEIAWSERRR